MEEREDEQYEYVDEENNENEREEYDEEREKIRNEIRIEERRNRIIKTYIELEKYRDENYLKIMNKKGSNIKIYELLKY